MLSRDTSLFPILVDKCLVNNNLLLNILFIQNNQVNYLAHKENYNRDNLYIISGRKHAHSIIKNQLHSKIYQHPLITSIKQGHPVRQRHFFEQLIGEPQEPGFCKVCQWSAVCWYGRHVW